MRSKSLTIVAALAIAGSAGAAAPSGPAVTTFAKGIQGWGVFFDNDGFFGDFVEAKGGNPAQHLRWTMVDTFGCSFHNASNSDFIGDYSRFAGGVEINVEIKVDSISTFGGQQVSRNLIVELVDYNEPGSPYPSTSVWFNLGPISQAQTSSWTRRSVRIDDPMAVALPPGWGGTGDEDPVTFEPILPPDRTFASVLANVEEIRFTTFEPGWFYGFTNFQLRFDNPSVRAIGASAPPSYTIVDLGVVQAGDSASQAMRVSPGGIVVGRSVGTPTQAFWWTAKGGIVGLPNLASPARPFGVANGANDSGLIVGTGSTTLFGSSPLPLKWEGGAVSQLPLPSGQTLGRANDVNASGVAVGSVGSGSLEFGCRYDGAVASVISTTTANGSFLRTAYGISDSGRVVGFGIDPNSAAVNVAYVLDASWSEAFAVPPLPGMNGGIAFDVSSAGHVCGSSMMNQGSGQPFVWSESMGSVQIPLPIGTSTGSARGVNSDGWVVGNAGGAFSVPFLFDGSTTYRLADLIPAGTGWDLSMNTSNSALGISEDGIIVGTSVRNGLTRAYALIPVQPPPSCPQDLNDDGMVDGNDLGTLLGSWGSCADCAADFNGDDQVDGNDLGTLLGAWGLCPGG